METKIDDGFNKRKAKCGFCGKELKKGEGWIKLSSVSGKRFFVCFPKCD